MVQGYKKSFEIIMKIYDQIISFPQQFLWNPKIEYGKNKSPKSVERIAICGMGGSALAGDIMRSWLERDDIIIHRDFYLPKGKSPDFAITVSYSGNTEETLTSFELALKKRIPVVAVSSGGKLEELSRLHKTPFIKLPVGFQPRQTIGYMLKTLTAILAPRHLGELEKLSALNPLLFKKKGEELSHKIFGKIPLIYSSAKLETLSYNWKIRLNETAKLPAFTAVIPEVFHNEMTSFDMGRKLYLLKNKFFFIILTDDKDFLETQKRIQIFKSLFTKKEFSVEIINFKDKSYLESFFEAVIIADWTSYFLALKAKATPEEVLWVEEFKRLSQK